MLVILHVPRNKQSNTRVAWTQTIARMSDIVAVYLLTVHLYMLQSNFFLIYKH